MQSAVSRLYLVSGIKNVILDRIESLYDLTINNDSIFSYELVEQMNEITRTIKKELCVVINRRGKITGISIGKVSSAEIPSIDVSDKKLSGYRVIHTHPTGNSSLSSMDTSALVDLRLDAIAAIGVNENIMDIVINIGFCDVYNNSITFKEIENLSLDAALQINFRDEAAYIDKMLIDVNQMASLRCIKALDA